MFPPDTVLSLSFLSEHALSTSVVWAYLDPGTGSLLFQMLIAGLLSGAYMCRSSLVSLRRLIGRGLSKNG